MSAGRGDGGYAMVTAVVLGALIVAVTGALVLSLTSGGRESARQRELYEARAAGASALEYLYARLGLNPDFFDGMLKRTSPDTHDWILLSTATGPDPAQDSDWREFKGTLGDGDFHQACSTTAAPCWTMRFKGDGTRTPRAVAAEAVVRFDCRGGGYCSVRRFHQQLRRTADTAHSWQRIDVAEVASDAALPPVSIAPDPPGKVTNLTATAAATTLTVTWDAPDTGGTPTGYHVQWKSDTQNYPTPPHNHDSTTTSYTIGSLRANTAHTVRVRAHNPDGNGAWSDEATFTTTE